MGVRPGFSEGPIGSGDRRRMRASLAEEKHLQTYGSEYGAEKVHLGSGKSIHGGSGWHSGRADWDAAHRPSSGGAVSPVSLLKQRPEPWTL